MPTGFLNQERPSNLAEMNKFQRSQSRKRHFWWENKGFPVDFPNHYQSIHCAQVLLVESFRASAVVRPCHAGDHQGSGAAADRIFWGPPWLKWRPREERATRGLWMPGLQGAVRCSEGFRAKPGGEIGDKFGDWETGFAAAFRSWGPSKAFPQRRRPIPWKRCRSVDVA